MLTIANNQPMPELKPYTVDSRAVYSLSTMNNDPPNIAQLTVIRGR